MNQEADLEELRDASSISASGLFVSKSSNTSNTRNEELLRCRSAPEMKNNGYRRSLGIPAPRRHLFNPVAPAGDDDADSSQALASSSYAIAGTLDTLKSRLLKLRDGLPPEEDVAEQLMLIEEMEEDYLEESDEATPGEQTEKQDSPKPAIDRKKLEAEIGELERF